MTKSELAEVLQAVEDMDPDFLLSAAWRGNECRLYFATYSDEIASDSAFRLELHNAVRYKLGFDYHVDEVQRAYYVDLLQTRSEEWFSRERD